MALLAGEGTLGAGAGFPLCMNHQIAAASAVSATPPIIIGIALLPPAPAPPLKVEARSAAGAAAAALVCASPSLAKRCRFASTSGCGMPLIDASASADIGVLRNASNFRCRTDSAAFRRVDSSRAREVALHVAFDCSVLMLSPPQKSHRRLALAQY